MRMRSRLGPFAQSAFTVYWSGGLVSNIGTWLQNVAAAVYVYDRTGSALAVGILNFAAFVPMLLFSVTGGVISDRLDRRLVIVVTHVVSFVISAALALLTIAGLTNELHVIATAFLLQVSWTLAKPSSSAMLPALMPRAQLREAVGLNTLQFMIAQLVGPVLATILLTTAGYGWAFSINALTFVGPIVAMAYLWSRGIGGRAARTDEAVEKETRSVVAYVRSQPWIASVLVGVISTSAVLEIIRTIAPPLVTTRLGAPSSDAGLVVAAASVGMVIGILASVPLGRRGHARAIAPIGLAMQFVGLLALAVTTDLAVAGAAVALAGCGFSFCFPVLTSTIQTEVPDAVRGRLLALHQMAHLGNRPFAALAAGALAASFGVTAACLGGMVLAPIGLIAVRQAWRGLDREAEPVAAMARTSV
jgi:MFS family permease